jgi:chromate transporter
MTIIMSRTPQSKMELFLAFNALTLQGFGGVMPIAERVLVDEKQWMTHKQFVEDFAVAQFLPGPNVINLALAFGRRHFGLGGALAAVGGLLALPLILIIMVASQYARMIDLPEVQGAFRGISVVAAGLVAGTSLKLSSALRNNPMGRAPAILLAGAGFGALALLHWPLYWVMLLIGGCGMLLSALALSRRDRRQPPREPGA